MLVHASAGNLFGTRRAFIVDTSISLLKNPKSIDVRSFPSRMKESDVISKSPVDVDLVARRASVPDRSHVFLSHVTLHLGLPLGTVVTKETNYPQVTLHCLGRHQSLHILRRIYKEWTTRTVHKRVHLFHFLLNTVSVICFKD